jgi:hypothetical protein
MVRGKAGREVSELSSLTYISDWLKIVVAIQQEKMLLKSVRLVAPT